MTEFLGISLQAILGQLLIGLINGSFYALLSLGLAVIFGMLNVINFAHGAQYMLGAFCAWLLLQVFGVGYWWALVLAPLSVALLGMIKERTMISKLYRVDHLYGLLLTFGFALIIEGLFRYWFGSSGQIYQAPDELSGGWNLGFMFMPKYRAWVVLFSIVVCLITWFAIEKTRLGSYLRASTENAIIVKSFGINVPLLMTLTYGFGAGLAGLAGVMAAPIYQVNPLMGTELVIVVFAVVVIGGMGSIKGAILTGYGLGVIEGLTRVFYPEASSVVIFVIMIIILLIKPEGLFGRQMTVVATPEESTSNYLPTFKNNHNRWLLFLIVAVALIVAPFYLYPSFLMKIMVFALFASAFNLIIGYAGLLSFGHAAFFGSAAYVTGYAMKAWGVSPGVGITLGVSAALVLGLLFGIVAIRRQGVYFAMITLSLAQVVYFISLRSSFTGGENGIQQIPRGDLLGLIPLSNSHVMYFFVLAVSIIGILFIRRLVFSPFGQVLRAIRENEPRMISLGYNVIRYKLFAFIISAGLAGLAGTLSALVFRLASLSNIDWHMSGEAILMTLLGGMGTLLGPIIGAGILTSLQHFLAGSEIPVNVITGIIFVLCVLMFRRGVVGELGNFMVKRNNTFFRKQKTVETLDVKKTIGQEEA